MFDFGNTGPSRYSTPAFHFADSQPQPIGTDRAPRDTPPATPRAARERQELGRLGSTIETGGTVFILVLMGLQTLAPLTETELAWRIILACWGLTAFRMVQTPGSKSFVLHALIQMLAMLRFAFTDPSVLNDGQWAIDIALISAGWVALISRLYMLLGRAQLRTHRGDVMLERYRRRATRGTAGL